jgi:hypothetical protein
MLFNNCRSRRHAQLFGTGAFYDLNQYGLQAHMAADLTPEQHCCVATPAEGDDIEFAWYCFSRERIMTDPDPRPGAPTTTVRVFFGDWLGSETISRAEAMATEPYAQFFNVNGHFKRPSAIRPIGECVAPAGLQQN